MKSAGRPVEFRQAKHNLLAVSVGGLGWYEGGRQRLCANGRSDVDCRVLLVIAEVLVLEPVWMVDEAEVMDEVMVVLPNQSTSI